MSKSVKRNVSRLLTLVMVLSAVFGGLLFTSNNSKAKMPTEPLPSDLQIDFGVSYCGEVEAVYDEDAGAWCVQYFNLNNSAFENGDWFFVSFDIAGADIFQQIAVQSSVNNWSWDKAPKKWNGSGVSGRMSGVLAADRDGNNLAFKIHMDNPTGNVVEPVMVTISNLYVVKLVGDREAELPSNLQLDFLTEYNGTVQAVKNADGVYETQFFNLNNSAYEDGDTIIIAAQLSGAAKSKFKQVAIQCSVNGWSWDESPKIWQNNGLLEEQIIAGSFTAVGSGSNIAFKMRFDTLIDGATLPDTIDVTIDKLIVSKPGDASLPLSEYLEMNIGSTYTGNVDVLPGDYDNYESGYFNVRNVTYNVGDQFLVTFNVNGADAFKQLNLQSSLDGWDFSGSRAIWQGEGIANGTQYSVILTANSAGTDFSFKLWLDNLVSPPGADKYVLRLNNLRAAAVPALSLPSLSDRYQNDFAIGAAISNKMLDDAVLAEFIKNQYGSITAENEMKPDSLLQLNQQTGGDPVINTYALSRILPFADDNEKEVRFHSLIYPDQTPEWFFYEGYNTSNDLLGATEMEARMESYINQVVAYVEANYPGVVTAWDVVNEALDDNGNYKDNLWKQIMGEDYVIKAFLYATAALDEAGSSATLFYNDYNLHLQDKIDKVIELYFELLENGARMDGVGMQLHATLNYPSVNNVESAIQDYSVWGLIVQITELDISLEEDQTETQQADLYDRFFAMFEDNAELIDNVTFWGVTDDLSWRAAKRPLPFKGLLDRLQAKEAFYSIID